MAKSTKILFTICFVAICIFQFAQAPNLNAQGALNRVKAKVNADPTASHQPKKSKKKNAESQPSEDHESGQLANLRKNVRRPKQPRTNNQNHSSRNQNHSSRHRANRFHNQYRSRSYRGHGMFRPVNYCPPPVVIHETYLHPVEQVPVFVPNSGLVERLPSYPLASGTTPNFPVPFASDWFQESSSRFSATVGADFDDLSQVGLGLLLQAPQSLGLDISVATLRENGMSFRDHLWLGDANVVVECINTTDFRGRIGLGINWLGASGDSDAGFNLTAGFDWRLNHNWTVIGEGDVGNLGDADFWHTRIGLARRFENAEWLTGVDHYDIGGENLHTIFTGLQFRF